MVRFRLASSRSLSAMPRVVIGPALPDRALLDNEIAHLRGLDVGQLRARWHTAFRRRAPPHLPRHLLFHGLSAASRSGSGNWMPTVDVCLTTSGRGLPMRPTSSWLTSTDPELS